MFNPMKTIYKYLYDEKFALQYNQKLLMNQIEALDSAINKCEDFDAVAWLKVGKARSEGELEKIQTRYDKVKTLMHIIENPFGIEERA